MNVPNFMSKASSYQDLRRGRGHHVPGSPRGMVRQKHPGVDRVTRDSNLLGSVWGSTFSSNSPNPFFQVNVIQ